MIEFFKNNIVQQNNWKDLINPLNAFLHLPGERLIVKRISLFFLILRAYLNAFLTAFSPGRIGKKR